jgi:hypothetical protein
MCPNQLLNILLNAESNINEKVQENVVNDAVGVEMTAQETKIKTKEPIEFCDDYCYFKCPNCAIYIIVFLKELNCKIFRCGVYKSNNQPINPHMPKNMCDELKKEDLIYGCSEPFTIREKYAEHCDYI